MAWRIDESVVRGEIDNRVKGVVRGRLWLKGVEEPVQLQLSGNAHRDLAGCLLTFKNSKLPVPMRGAGKATSRPLPSPPGLIIAHKFGALFGQSQRDCVLQPGVARRELPWERPRPQPRRSKIVLRRPHEFRTEHEFRSSCSAPNSCGKQGQTAPRPFCCVALGHNPVGMHRRLLAVFGGIEPGFRGPPRIGRSRWVPGDSPAGTTENSPAIHRWAGSRQPESPAGTKEPPLGLGSGRA